METAKREYSVEHLTLDDYVWSVEVAATRMLLEELKRPELLDRENIYMLVDKMIADGTALIVKHQGKPVGALGALLLPNTFNPDITTLAEVIWYVLPEYRNTRAGMMLMQGYIEMAEMADEATMSLLPSSDVNLQSMAKRGFILEEYAFRKQVRKT